MAVAGRYTAVWTTGVDALIRQDALVVPVYGAFPVLDLLARASSPLKKLAGPGTRSSWGNLEPYQNN